MACVLMKGFWSHYNRKSEDEYGKVKFGAYNIIACDNSAHLSHCSFKPLVAENPYSPHGQCNI